MIVLPETTKTATVLNVHGDNGVWKKPKNLANNKDGHLGSNITKYAILNDGISAALLWLTNFNKTDLMGAQTSNHCLGGLCFKSNTYFKPRSILLLRINSEDYDFSCTGDLKGLRTITLGEVKWSKEIIRTKQPMV